MASVLIIGDSHSNGYYGSFLQSMFEKAGFEVTKVARVGITAAGYLAGRESSYSGKGTLAGVQGTGFDIAIITLGTNDAAGLSSTNPPGRVAKTITDLADSLSANKIFYVGPPAFSDNAALTYNAAFANYDLNRRSQDLWSAVSPSFGPRAIDSREVTAPYVKQKNIHFDADGGKAWAEYVFGEVTKAPAPEVATTPIVIEQNSGLLLLGASVVLLGFVFWRRTQRKLRGDRG